MNIPDYAADSVNILTDMTITPPNREWDESELTELIDFYLSQGWTLRGRLPSGSIILSMPKEAHDASIHEDARPGDR